MLGKVTEVDSDQPKGAITAQNPPAQSQVDAGSLVDVSVSNGKAKVPTVVGASEAQARSELINAGFEVNVTAQEDGTVPAGQVLAQSPKAGTSAVKGTLVTITVAKAPPAPTPTPTPSGTTAPLPSPSVT